MLVITIKIKNKSSVNKKIMRPKKTKCRSLFEVNSNHKARQ